MGFNLLTYITSSGKDPIGNWLAAMKDIKGKAKIRTRINQLRLGHFGIFRPVGE